MTVILPVHIHALFAVPDPRPGWMRAVKGRLVADAAAKLPVGGDPLAASDPESFLVLTE